MIRFGLNREEMLEMVSMASFFKFFDKTDPDFDMDYYHDLLCDYENSVDHAARGRLPGILRNMGIKPRDDLVQEFPIGDYQENPTEWKGRMLEITNYLESKGL